MMVLAATVAPTLEFATMVVRLEAKRWESPAFRGRPFWPVFEKMSHKDDSPYTNRLGAARRVFFRLGICYTTKANRTTGEDE